MSRYSSLDYLLKKTAAAIHKTITEPPTNSIFKDIKSSLEEPSLFDDSDNLAVNIPKHATTFLPFMLDTAKFSIQAAINKSFDGTATEEWTDKVNLSTSKAFLEIDYAYTSESDLNDTHPGADHLLENWWNIFDERYLKHGWGWTITLIVAYMSILVAGVIGNVMVILVVLLRPQMRTVTNMFITNLAVADLFVIVFCVPSTLLANMFSPWILGSFMCKAVAYVQGVSGCASAYSLAAISLDRCQAVYRNYERPRGFSQRICVRTVLVIWIAAMTLTIPWAVIFEVKVSEYDGLRYCVESWEDETHGNIYFLIVNLLCFYAVPLLLIFVSNWIIYCHVTHRHVPDNSVSSAPLRKMHRDTKHHVLKMLGIVTLTFLLCWLPIYILVIIIKFAENMTEAQFNVLGILMPIAQWLGSCNSGVNPILYAFLNKRFRHMCTSILPSWFPIKPSKKYTAAFSTRGLTTMAYSRKSQYQNGTKHVPNATNQLISEFHEHAGTVSTTTVQTLTRTKSANSMVDCCTQGSDIITENVEQARFEIITDL